MNGEILNPESDLYKILVQAGVIKDGEEARFVTPQFERIDGRKPLQILGTVAFFDWLRTQSENLLREYGLQTWEVRSTGDRLEQLWLFPHEWYDHIPEGYEVVDIFWEVEQFKHGETDDDKRMGALPYGFTKEY